VVLGNLSGHGRGGGCVSRKTFPVSHSLFT
jgi:hypothetical protein